MSANQERTYRVGDKTFYYHPYELLSGFLFSLDMLARQKEDPHRAESAKEMLKVLRESALLGPWELSYSAGSVAGKIIADQAFLADLFSTYEDHKWSVDIEYQERWWNDTYHSSILEGPNRYIYFDNIIIDRQKRKGVVVPMPAISKRHETAYVTAA